MQLIIIKIKTKLKNRSHRYDINSHRSRHGHECSKYKKCLTMVMLVCIKQHLSNIEAQFMVKLSNTEAELKKSVVYKKKHVLENVDKVFSNVQNSKKSNFFLL